MSSARRVRDSIVRGVDALGFGAHGLHVLVGTDEAAHRWTDGVREDVQSASKAICVLAAGIAADEGLIDIDAPVGTCLPGVELGDGVEFVTLRHLLTMTSGIDLPWSESMMSDWPDLAREFLRRPSRGRVFQYSNASTYTAMRVLATKVGDVAEFVSERLFAPLGIIDVEWERCPNGWIVAGEHPGYDRYALAGWGGPGQAWRIHGAYGQMMIFLGDAVVTITASDHFGADAMAQRIVETLEAERTS
ncbi:serine hydrolase domain-containing protein [Pseudoclavibacter helvolus]|uniref:serine hydrolase domain-containing protein n=1 Tax=Pseudoclavibacter helvolus TaxID=255205 RepID=UPI000838C104|nr:serine hydrolase [Pseudoclavibacter helvolus]